MLFKSREVRGKESRLITLRREFEQEASPIFFGHNKLVTTFFNEQNKRIQKENNAPEDFPSFIREGFQVRVVTPPNYITRDSGLTLRDFVAGEGDCPEAGQQVMFHYVGYNESGRRIDSSYTQGSPARIAWAQMHWSQVKSETNSRVHKILRTFSFALAPLLRPKKETEKREAER